MGRIRTRAITKNTRVIDYAGETILNKESLKREIRYLKRGHIWCFKLTNRTAIDAGVGGNIARFINHACKPNCYIDIKDGVIWIRAGEEHPKGEETDLPLPHRWGMSHRVSVSRQVPDATVTARHVLYLHGFASSSASTKANYFRERFSARGVHVVCPDFNEPGFATLTITRNAGPARARDRPARTGPDCAHGSSLGGTLAILAAERFATRVDRLVLMAPAVMFAKPGHHLLSPDAHRG